MSQFMEKGRIAIGLSNPCIFVIILIMSLLLKYNTFYLLAEITLKHGLQSTEEYFPYIAYAFFVFLLCKKECSI